MRTAVKHEGVELRAIGHEHGGTGHGGMREMRVRGHKAPGCVVQHSGARHRTRGRRGVGHRGARLLVVERPGAGLARRQRW